MRTEARPKSGKNDSKKKFPGGNLETGLTGNSEAGNSTTGSIFEEPCATNFSTEVSHEKKYQLIAESAYFRSEKRNFAPGNELDDWLAAEAEVAFIQKIFRTTPLIQSWLGAIRNRHFFRQMEQVIFTAPYPGRVAKDTLHFGLPFWFFSEG